MMQWSVLLGKEVLEMWRNFKWIWLPLVFILLGAMQPVTTYYMPQILESMGGLPEGAVIEIPMPTGGEMLAKVLSQFGTLGVLVLVLAGMGLVSAEKQSRSVSLIMVRPVPHGSWISAKWASYLLIGLSSLATGYLAGWYYTELLIGSVNVGRVFAALALYGIWLIFIMTVTLLMTTLLKGSGETAFSSIIITILFSTLTGFLDTYMMWSPARMSAHSASVLMNGEVGEGFMVSLICSILLIALFLCLAVWSFKKQELAD